eukprot:401080_1
MDQLNSIIFKQENDNDYECNRNDYMQCKPMKRLFAALKHYSMLNITGNQMDKEVWNRFVNEIYGNFIDDYIHFNNEHSHELETIHNEIINGKTILNPCKISKCAFTSRHHEQTSKTNENELNPTEHFYKQTMDSLHFYLHHSFEYFNNMKLETQHISKEFDRFKLKKTSKFNIKVANEQIESENDTTFLDRLIEHLKNENV